MKFKPLKLIFTLLGFAMLIGLASFMWYVLNHPELSGPLPSETVKMLLAAYITVMFAMFGLGIFVQK